MGTVLERDWNRGASKWFHITAESPLGLADSEKKKLASVSKLLELVENLVVGIPAETPASMSEPLSPIAIFSRKNRRIHEIADLVRSNIFHRFAK